MIAIRVIAGSASGRRLKGVPGDSARPTSDRVRESLFSILADVPRGAVVLDLYAGAGTLGIECLSRGAARCVFVDTNRAACRVINANIDALGFSGVAEVVCKSAAAALAGKHRVVSERGPYDLVFADPPYDLGAWPGVLTAVVSSPAVSREALIVIEHSSRTPTPPTPDGLELVRQSTYGDTGLSFYQFTSR